MANIAGIRQPVEKSWREYERLVKQELGSGKTEDNLLHDVLRYVGTTRGKQLRPMVVLLAAQLCNPVTDKTLRTAAALELLHNASLVHDDVVDSSDTRRGLPSLRSRWNNKIAVLTGDYLLAQVIGLVAEVRNIRILEIVSDLGRSLSGGEMLQLHAGQSMWIDEQQYFRVILLKTARLFQACAEGGAESAGCTPRQRAALRDYGKMLGICFQIKDDLFDYSDLEDLGKPTMSDLEDGKVTLPLIVALRRATTAEAQHIREIGEMLSQQNTRDKARLKEEIKSFVLRYHGDEYAVQQMNEYRKKAAQALSVFLDCEEKKSLVDLLDYAVNRIQ